MNMIFQLSIKTKVPHCNLGWECCGNKFGRIERSKHCKVHSGINRIKRTRRYAKHVEKQLIKKDINNQLVEELMDYDELKEFFKYEIMAEEFDYGWYGIDDEFYYD